MALDLAHVHRVHCVGIGGIGVSAAAKFLRLQGKDVSGSDAARSVITADAERAGIRVVEPSAENVAPDLDLLLYTSAAPETHPERQAAAAFGIPQLSYFEFLGLLSQGCKTVAVSGTNGKSTTTAMLGLILERAGLDPTVIVGSRVPQFEYGNLRMDARVAPQAFQIQRVTAGDLSERRAQASVRAGSPGGQDPLESGLPTGDNEARPLLVVEACEYREQFMSLSPWMIVVTKIVEDHLDYYRNLAHIQGTFKTFAAKANGPLIWNGDDPASRETFAGWAQPNGTFGFSKDADVRAENHETSEGLQRFDAVWKDGAAWRGLELRVPGAFNVLNALAALGAARALGASEEAARAALAEFKGIWRRFEKVGERDDAPVISDYGHTPDAIEATLKAAKEFYPGRKLVLAFQPHHHDRTRKLFDAFVPAFDGADALILSEIYGVEGRREGEREISSRDLAEAVTARGRVSRVSYAADPAEALRQLEAFDPKNAIMLVMGAGDIYSIADLLCRTSR